MFFISANNIYYCLLHSMAEADPSELHPLHTKLLDWMQGNNSVSFMAMAFDAIAVAQYTPNLWTRIEADIQYYSGEVSRHPNYIFNQIICNREYLYHVDHHDDEASSSSVDDDVVDDDDTDADDADVLDLGKVFEASG